MNFTFVPIYFIYVQTFDDAKSYDKSSKLNTANLLHTDDERTCTFFIKVTN